MWSEKVARWLEHELELKAGSGGPPSDEYKLVWSDEFDGPGLDTQKWKHRYIGPRKDGINDPSSISTDGQGNLLITCSRKDDKILAGMISTDGLFSATYGYFEARVRFQTQEGWWPGFWLMSNTVGDPDRGLGVPDDTARNGTEVDIFEYLRIRGDQIQHAMHWNGYGKSHKHRGQHARVPNLTSGYHTVGCEWLPDRYRFFVDGRMTWETTEAVSQRPEYIILSGEVSSWPGDISRAVLPDSVSFDYIRVWQKP
jgi:beta-glucanase (GH16 family)